MEQALGWFVPDSHPRSLGSQGSTSAPPSDSRRCRSGIEKPEGAGETSWHRWEHLDPSWRIRDRSWRIRDHSRWIRDHSCRWIRNSNPSMSSGAPEAGNWGWKTNVGIDPMENPPRRLGRGWNLPGIPWINCSWNELLVLPSLGSGFHRVNPGIFSILAASLPGYSHFSLEYSFLWPNSLVPAFQILPLRGFFFLLEFFFPVGAAASKIHGKTGALLCLSGNAKPVLLGPSEQENRPEPAERAKERVVPRTGAASPRRTGNRRRDAARPCPADRDSWKSIPRSAGPIRPTPLIPPWKPLESWLYPPAPGSRFRALQGRDDPGRRHPMDLTPVFHEFCHRLGIRFRRGGFFFR